MDENQTTDAALRVSARIDRAGRIGINRPGTLRERAKFVTDIVVEDLSTTGCRISVDDEIPMGTTVSIGLPGVGMQAARIVRSEGQTYGCAFLLPITEEEVQRALTTVVVEELAFPKLRERVRAEAALNHSRHATDTSEASFRKLLLARFK